MIRQEWLLEGTTPVFPPKRGNRPTRSRLVLTIGRGRRKRRRSQGSRAQQVRLVTQVGSWPICMKESQRQAAKAEKALKELQAATVEVERAQRGPVPKPLPAAEPMQVDQPAVSTSTQESSVDAKKGSSEGGRAASEDSSKATPTKPVKAGKVKALTSSLPPPSAIRACSRRAGCCRGFGS